MFMGDYLMAMNSHRKTERFFIVIPGGAAAIKAGFSRRTHCHNQLLTIHYAPLTINCTPPPPSTNVYILPLTAAGTLVTAAATTFIVKTQERGVIVGSRTLTHAGRAYAAPNEGALIPVFHIS
jgi:hypothetical protein